MQYKIPPRDGVEVFVNQGGGVTIKQETMYDGEATISLHLDEVLQLIELLKKVHQDALDFAAEEPSDTPE